MEGRVTFEEGDILRDELPRGAEVVLAFNVIRILTPEELDAFIGRIHASLAPGGLLLILDHLGGRPRTPFVQANNDLILLELYNSTAGRTHPAAAVERRLLDAGFAKARTASLQRSPGLGMIRAVK
jgi:SAM-dependent methyltransferase